MSGTINNSQLKAGTKIYVEGEVNFSRIANIIQDTELAKDIERKRRLGMNPIEKPYTTITINNAKIRPVNPSGLSIEEQFIQEKFYQSKSNPGGMNYTINNKSPYLPAVAQFDPQTNTAPQINLEGNELAVGLKVILELIVYQPKSFTNKGIGLNSVMLMEPARFYGGASGADFSALGIQYKPLPSDEARKAMTPSEHKATNVPTMDSNDNAYANAQPVASPTGNPYATAQPTPVAQAQPTPVQNSTPVAQAQTMVATATTPAQAQAPVEQPASPWVCQSCGTTVPAGQVFCGGCGSKKPEAPTVMGGGNPYAQPTAAAPQGGISYNPNDVNRNY